MVYDRKLLRAKMSLNDYNASSLSQDMNMSRTTFWRKVTETENCFNVEEIIRMRNLLFLSDEEIIRIFFNKRG